MKVLDKIKANFQVITVCLLLLIFLRQCGANSDINRLSKQSKTQSAILDSVCTREELGVLLEIEGLKAEKRMIQSTDRKIMDVNRQSEIDLEIKKLEKNKK